ncbi:poly-gamma-glutamate biosynthesis protein PgsC [Rhodopirellula bahusiensis]|uniref:Poly-gamma-glutamate biosynthesis protein PgsC n=1 Tax=Rhodopirellula bahusiensis TaxID=2014065 RepID=A0A2G1VZ72_9BACT|nr:poly-gamma-glutamate biosynthesis protein PgsC [Rhodopirellula bahusiensis]PHQ31910.1 poly-gamma-glutamate biosynthesis protein PgsC [Rhodopirellula bahusiensis]
MEWLALSIGIGLVVSLIFTEAFGLSVGGMIVPGYLALAFDQPATIIATIAAALVTAWVVYQIDRWAILFGRRRVVLTMVVGFAIAAMLRSMVELAFPAMPVGVVVEGSTSAASMMMAGTTVIGFVIPGLVALWIARSGVVQTLSPLVIATSLVYLVLVTAGVETLV